MTRGDPSMAKVDYSVGFSLQEVEEILAAHKAELRKTLASWSDSGSSATRRQIAEIHEVIAACQDALRKLAPEKYGAPARVSQSVVSGVLPK